MSLSCKRQFDESLMSIQLRSKINAYCHAFSCNLNDEDCNSFLYVFLSVWGKYALELSSIHAEIFDYLRL